MRKKRLTTILNALFLIMGTVMLTGCDDNQLDPFGEAKVKIVNAASHSRTQEFFLINEIIARDLDYAESTNSYITVNSGDNLVARFIDQINGDRYASSQIDLDKKRNYTIYLGEDGNHKGKIFPFKDNLSSPAGGKAKVKFIHLSGSGPQTVSFTAANVSYNVGRNNESAYFEVNAGSIAVSANAQGASGTLASIQTPQLVAGRVYTVVFTTAYNNGYDLLLIRN